MLHSSRAYHHTPPMPNLISIYYMKTIILSVCKYKRTNYHKTVTGPEKTVPLRRKQGKSRKESLETDEIEHEQTV